MTDPFYGDEEPKIGRVYRCRVKRVYRWGIFCEVLGTGKEGLIHGSEVVTRPHIKLKDIIRVGDEFRAKLIAIDQSGRLNLSRTAAINKR